MRQVADGGLKIVQQFPHKEEAKKTLSYFYSL
jgi:hypothetical protein